MMDIHDLHFEVRRAVTQTRTPADAARMITMKLPPEAWLVGLRVYLNETELAYGPAALEEAEAIYRDAMREAA